MLMDQSINPMAEHDRNSLKTKAAHRSGLHFCNDNSYLLLFDQLQRSVLTVQRVR